MPFTDVSEVISKALDRLSADIGDLLGFEEKERLEISVMVFGEHDRKVRLVAHNSERKANLYKTAFSFGEGLAGFTFASVRPTLFRPGADPFGIYIRPDELDDAARDLPETALISFPWIYQEHIDAGVVNVGSRRADTQLLRLFDLDDTQREQTLIRLNGLINTCGGSILEMARKLDASSLGSG